MKTAVPLATIGCFLLAGSITALSADIIDSFSYSTGPLSTVSSGYWRVWMNGANDAQVAGQGNPANGVQFDASYGDVVAYSPQDLFAGGAAAVAFDFFVPSNTDNMALSVVLGAGDPAANSINYGSGGTITTVDIGYGRNDDGVDIHLWGTGFGAFPLVTVVSPDQWHRLGLSALASGTFSISVDGAPVGGNYPFQALTDPHGFNAIEVYSAHIPNTPARVGYYLLDNLSVTGTNAVPEPGTVVLLAAGLLALGRRALRRLAA